MGQSATLSAETGPCCAAGARQDPTQEDVRLNSARALDHFLSSVEKRAFRIASIALRDPEEALDVVQDAMLQLARRYGSRPAGEWMPLFYRILQNRIRDSQRRKTVHNRIFAWWPGSAGDNESADDAGVDAADGRPAPDALVANGDPLLRWGPLAGAILFGFSDTLIGIHRFHQPLPGAAFAIILTYWMAQALFAATAIARKPPVS